MLVPSAALERAVTIREVVLRAMSGAISWMQAAECPIGAEYSEMFQQSAALVDKILKGAKPADLPVEQPWLVINLKTAKALRLTTPPSLLARADQVIEQAEKRLEAIRRSRDGHIDLQARRSRGYTGNSLPEIGE
jgi:hypothetical protein